MHPHHHAENLKSQKIAIAVFLNVLITLGEVLGSIFSGSLSLLTDAVHNFSDVLALVFTGIAHKISLKKADLKGTFGYKRAEIVAALFNSTTLLGIAIFIIYKGVEKFFNPTNILPEIVIYLAILSILLNFLSAFILRSDSKENLNIRSAYLHLLTDLFTSIAVLLGGILISLFRITWVDSLISILIAIYLMIEAFKIVKKSISILMQFSPGEIKIEDLEREILKINGIKNVHHIHIWMLNEREIFFEAHIDFVENLRIKEANRIIENIEDVLKKKFNISHITIQPEFERNDDKSLIVGRG